MRAHLSTIVGDKFDDLLQLNKYSGSLVFNHKKGTLGITVKKQSEKNDVETTDVKGLR